MYIYVSDHFSVLKFVFNKILTEISFNTVKKYEALNIRIVLKGLSILPKLTFKLY